MDQQNLSGEYFRYKSSYSIFHLCGKLKEALKLGLLVYQCSSAHETYGEVFFLYKVLPYAFSHVEVNPK